MSCVTIHLPDWLIFFFICGALLDYSPAKEDYSFSINTAHLSTVLYQDKTFKAKQVVIKQREKPYSFFCDEPEKL